MNYIGKLPNKILSFLVLLCPVQILCGQGMVRGVISDKTDNSPLFAATVTVKGTSVGIVSDYNGAYILPLKAGSHILQVSYLGYASQEDTISIEDGQTVEYNVALAVVPVMGEEVVVTAQAKGQLAAVNQQLRSNQIINVVSAERIRELPDENAAQAVSRLPGVHLDGFKVVIRGVEPKMNKIQINGVEMPSTEWGERATDLGMISANMLSGIEVIKTLTPDMDADAVGGVVNLRIRDSPAGFHFSLMALGGYNQQEKYMGDYKLWGDISKRFLDNRLGMILNMNYEKRNYGNDWYTRLFRNNATSTDFWEGDYLYSGINVYDEFNTSDKIGGTLVLDFDLPRGQFIYSGMLSHAAVEETRHQDYMYWTTGYHRLHLYRSNFNQLLLNNTLRFEYQIGMVNLDLGASNVSLNNDANFSYGCTWVQNTVSNFFTDSITHQNIRGAGPWDFYTWMNPEAEIHFRGTGGGTTPWVMDENRWLADLDVKVPVRISEKIDMDIKLGGKYKRFERFFDRMALTISQQNQSEVNQSCAAWLTEVIGHDPVGSTFFFEDWRDENFTPNEGYMNNEGARMDLVTDVGLMDELWQNQLDLNPETTKLDVNATDAMYDYSGFENHYAGYLMGEIKLGKRFVILPGVRVELVHKEYTAPKVERRSGYSLWFAHDTLTRAAEHSNWLPHLHLRFRATDWWDIRFSYNHTLTRPDYNYALPSVYYNTSDGVGQAGNPHIRPATSENLDVNFTFYSRKLGLFTVGGFYKTLKDVFYMQETILKNIPDTSIVNEFPIETYASLRYGKTDFYVNSPYEAYIKGLEVEWQSNFTWLPSPFNGLVLNANYTHVWSDTKYMWHRVLSVIPDGEWLPIPVESDTFYSNRLLQQADDIANLSLGYDYKGFSARLSFRFQGAVVSYIASLPQLNEYTDDVYKFDLAVKQKIPFKFGDLELFFNAINFTNVPYGRYVDYPVHSGGETVIQRQTTYKRYTGRQFQLGIRFKH